MSVYDSLVRREKILCVIGLGYVGMPLAIAFSEKVNVIGFDINQEKIRRYQEGSDPTMEVGDERIRNSEMVFSSDESVLDDASFFIVAVPTPINNDKTPDLNPVLEASRIVGKHLKPGDFVVYESTVYPGCTEEKCIPVLEKQSNLKCGTDFRVGYSPERINPGDKIHRLNTITKIVSGMDDETLDIVMRVYDLVIDCGTYPVSNIRTAEAIKLVENSQRDINIAFMNEMAIVFERLGIDTNEVVDGMNTKWSALGFRPGLVGGHCIGVDPYYFTYEAEQLGYHSQIVSAGRKVNDDMGAFVGEVTIRRMALSGHVIREARVGIFGLTFKENCPDMRNTKVVDIIRKLNQYGINPIVTDPYGDPEEVRRLYGIDIVSLDEMHDLDCMIVAVSHDEYRAFSAGKLNSFFRNCRQEEKVLIDVKGVYPVKMLKEAGFNYWRL